MHHPPHCPGCGKNEHVFVYSQQPNPEGTKTITVYTCVCGCVFSRQADVIDQARDRANPHSEAR